MANGSGTTYQSGASYVLNSNTILYTQWTLSQGFDPIDPPVVGRSQSAPGNTGTQPTQIYVYHYTNDGWKDQLSSIELYERNTDGVLSLNEDATKTFDYDNMGNPTSYDGINLTWEGKQLTGSSKSGQNISYAYDENGLRTQKTVNGVTTNYYYNGSILMGMVKGSGSSAIHQLFSYDANGNVVSVDYSSNGGSTFTTYYYLRNAQNDVVKLIDGSGNTVVEYRYDSWGKLVGTTGSLAGTVGLNNPFRYRGYVYDTETQWYYLQSRYYNPVVRQWISPEPNMYSGGFDIGARIIGYSVYAYCANNPVNNFDPSGEFIISTLLICIGVGIAVGGTVGGIVGNAYAKSKGYTGSDRTKCILIGIGFGGMAGGALGYYAAPAVAGLTGVAGVSITSAGVSTIAVVGTSFGKLGTLIVNNGQQVIDWGRTTWHGIQRLAERGISQNMIETWVRTGKALQQSGDKILYITQQGAVV